MAMHAGLITGKPEIYLYGLEINTLQSMVDDVENTLLELIFHLRHIL